MGKILQVSFQFYWAAAAAVASENTTDLVGWLVISRGKVSC